MADVQRQALFRAAKFGDEEEIRSLLEEGELRIKRKDKGETALHVAVLNGHENVVRLLCKSKADLLFIKDKNSRTPLHIAVYQGNVKMAKILCEHVSPIKHRDKEGNTPLLIAVLQNNPEMVTTLVNHGAFSTNVDHHSPINPLHIALEKNYKFIVQILVKYGDLVDICSCPSYPDPEFAKEIFNQCLGMQITSGCLKRKKKRRMENALYHAVFYGRDYQVKRLIESGARVNKKFGGITPLHKAVEERHLSIIQFLLTKGADVNAIDSEGDTPLHYVSKPNRFCRTDLQQKNFEDSLKIMKILLKNRASVYIFNKRCKTPLHNAVEEEEFRPEKIQLLLDYGANINGYITDRYGRDFTPIFSAKCGAILQMLIEKGADVNFGIWSNSMLATPLHYAIEENDFTKVDILLENGAEINSLTVNHLKRVPEISERVIDGNIIPILAKGHFQGEVTIDYEEFLSASGIFFSKFKECLEELGRIRKVNVLNLNLFDFLAMPIKKLRNYATNEEVLKVLESGTIQDTFPTYSGTIMRRFKKAKEERDLIDSSWVAFEKFIFNFHKIHLPDLVVYKILDLLNMVELERLVKL